MQAHEAAGVAQGAADGRDGQGRGVGGEQAVVLDDVLQLAQQLLFHVEPLQDGLDDEEAVREVGEVGGGPQAGPCRVPVGRG